MKIIMDARMQYHGGIGTYIRNLLPHLQVEPLHLKSSIYTLSEQIEYFFKIPHCDVFWAPHYNVPYFPVRAQERIVTIHDTYHLDHPQSLSKKLYAKILFQKAVNSAAHIITVSEFSKKRILHYFPRVENKITVIQSGADHMLSVKPKPMGIPTPFFLFVGSKKPHKNHAMIRSIIPNLIIVDGSLPVENLCWLYKQAEALIFPSLYEGWGLPPLEAMSLGCPVLASNAASIPEACQDAALYFDPLSPEELKGALALLPQKRDRLSANGKKRSAQLTWKHAARQHAEVFTYLLN